MVTGDSDVLEAMKKFASLTDSAKYVCITRVTYMNKVILQCWQMIKVYCWLYNE